MSEFDIDLPDGAAHARVIERRVESGHTVVRYAVGDVVSTVTFAEGRMLAHLWSERLNEYIVRQDADGARITSIGADADFECHLAKRAVRFAGRAAESGSNLGRRRAADPQPRAEIRMLLLRVAGEAPSVSDSEARLRFAHAVDLMNTALSNSGLSWIHFTSAGLETITLPKDVEVGDPAEGSSDPNHDALAWVSDAGNATVTALRRQYGADLVTLEAEAAPLDITYRPFPTAADPAEGFIVLRSLFSGDDATGGTNDYAMVALHEWGHALGGDHNEEDAAVPLADDLAPYARCAYHCGVSGWRGPLAYSGHCSSSGCVGYCTPIAPRYPLFSNPAITFRGIAAGTVDRADNARAFKLVAPLVANYMP